MNICIPQSVRLLIVDDIHPVLMELLEKEGVVCDYQPDISRDEALAVLGNYDGLVLRSKFKVDQTVLDAGTKLKFIGRAGAGIDNIDQAGALQKGIVLFSANEGNCDAVAEHMLGMLLSMLNNIVRADAEIRQSEWNREENRGVELAGKTVALIGYGHNGKAMARKLSGFDVKVIAYDKYKHGYGGPYAEEVAMEEIFQEADILSLHIPLSDETRGLVNEQFIARFVKPIYFLNGSRGEVVDMKALVDGLEQGSIAGAALDVLPVERFPDLSEKDWFGRLKTFHNVLLSPHVAGWSVESYFKLSEFLAVKIREFVKADLKKS